MAEPDPNTINKVTWMIPNALALVGSRSGDEWNGMTASWITQVSMEPVLVGVGVDNKAVTHRLISQSGAFTINLWSPEETKVFVKFSKPAAKEDMTLNGRAVTEGQTGAPIFDDALAWMECETRHAFDMGTHTFFVGEIVGVGVGDGGDDEPERAAALSDTRMKYGGVKRGGH